MTTSSIEAAFDAGFVDALRFIFEDGIVFNRTLGLQLDSISASYAQARLEMRSELIGHASYNRLHGGVISASLDALGGVAVLAALGARQGDVSVAERLQCFAKLGTIDLRVEYLRPAIGARFVLRAEVLRLGSRVAATRMEFRSEDGVLLSTGAASYIVS